ncbi:IDEAL domain-containing protein [Mesobacillus subterraneus]|uniref:IDEAL domain-containing protein n=1 Tax=Mesobacillus subterraneus TaxID=285983 RepID=UPI002040CE69|nr:IDEAL domain-containing protein [Mesobacillus subterraneus]MCM3573308.1 IDEAL domain-containing protein [Mesobacillus subterraneus]
METTSNALMVGDWVKIVGHSMLNNFAGFILKHDKNDERYRILITRDSRGNKTQGALWVDESQIVLYQTIRDEDDLFCLIDMALDMKDEEWFKELTNMLPLGNF